MNTKETNNVQPMIISTAQLLEHWQGHRHLTRKVIEFFPEQELFHFSIGSMRPFADMVKELLAITEPGIKQIVTGQSSVLDGNLSVMTKEELLRLWDATTIALPIWWDKLTVEKFQEMILAFGQYQGTVTSTILYYIDNEIHHRGQGYVYLRALGISPPSFWER